MKAEMSTIISLALVIQGGQPMEIKQTRTLIHTSIIKIGLLWCTTVSFSTTSRLKKSLESSSASLQFLRRILKLFAFKLVYSLMKD